MNSPLQRLAFLIIFAMIAMAVSPLFGLYLGFLNMLRIIGGGLAALLVLVSIQVFEWRRPA